MKFKEKTPELLRLYFGLDQSRGVKKSELFDELIRRGVGPASVFEAIDCLLFAVGWAADNRIEEIDAQLDEKDEDGGLEKQGVDVFGDAGLSEEAKRRREKNE